MTREFTAYTGKSGAIAAYVALTERILNYGKDLSADEIADRLSKYRLKLEKELEEGVYMMSSDPKREFLTYIGKYYDSAENTK